MFLICVDTVHHFLIRGIKLAVLSLYCQQLIIQQSELSLSLFLDFPQDPKSKTICQSICCIKHRCIWLYGIYPWIPKIPKCIAMISQTLWGAESCKGTLEGLGRSSCIPLTATQVHRLCGGGGVLVRRNGVRVGRVPVKEGGWRCVEISICYFSTTAYKRWCDGWCEKHLFVLDGFLT